MIITDTFEYEYQIIDVNKDVEVDGHGYPDYLVTLHTGFPYRVHTKDIIEIEEL